MQALPGLVDGSLNVPIERVFDWRDVQQAHALMQSNAIKGKVVCRVGVSGRL
jgi:NADPH:quinone reductase-like Zn-dependent oxidoreductase